MVDHPRDLAADFRAFYRLSWRHALMLPGPEFLALAYRTPAYGGVMAARIEQGRDDGGTRVDDGDTRVRQVEGRRSAITADPVLSSVIDFG